MRCDWSINIIIITIIIVRLYGCTGVFFYFGAIVYQTATDFARDNSWDTAHRECYYTILCYYYSVFTILYQTMGRGGCGRLYNIVII